MARIEIKGIEEISGKLMQLKEAAEPISKMAVYDGAKIVADEARRQTESLPVDKGRWLNEGDQYDAVTARDKADLLRALGIREITSDESGTGTVVGFAGYGKRRTHKYPNGLPMPMIARAIQSGSSVRKKHPFMRAANAKSKKAAKAAMIQTASTQIDRTLNQ